MFHLMLGFMALGMLAVVIAIALIPMWLGPLVQALIAVFSKEGQPVGSPVCLVFWV